MLALLVICAVAAVAQAQTECVDVKPVPGFEAEKFKGQWKEIGKIQTAGGAVWQDGCVCNSMNFTPNKTSTKGDASVNYSCNDETPTGEVRAFDAKLEGTGVPGKFKQVIFEFIPKVDWTVIAYEGDYGMTYDCAKFFGGVITNYCIHIISRSPTLDEAKVKALLAKAEGLGLNPEKLAYEAINHNGCK